MMLVSSPTLTPEIGKWVSNITSDNGEMGFNGNYNAIGVVENNELIAGFVYHDWHPVYQTIHMTLASIAPKWATRRVIEGLLRYPFIELKVQRITVTINENNHSSLRLAEGVGFKREAILERGAGPFGSIIVLRLFIEEWRSGKFNRMNYYETISAQAA